MVKVATSNEEDNNNSILNSALFNLNSSVALNV